MNRMQAYDAFWNSFGIPAYDENSVPSGVAVPYITYEVSDDSFGNTLALTASVWYRSSSWTEVTEKTFAIEEFLGRGGRMVGYDSGAFWIRKGTPWAQRMGDDSDDMLRRIALNVEIEFLT